MMKEDSAINTNTEGCRGIHKDRTSKAQHFEDKEKLCLQLCFCSYLSAKRLTTGATNYKSRIQICTEIGLVRQPPDYY